MKLKGIKIDGVKLSGGKVVATGPKPRDAAQARSWAKGGRKKQTAVSKGKAAHMAARGK